MLIKIWVAGGSTLSRLLAKAGSELSLQPYGGYSMLPMCPLQRICISPHRKAVKAFRHA